MASGEWWGTEQGFWEQRESQLGIGVLSSVLSVK